MISLSVSVSAETARRLIPKYQLDESLASRVLSFDHNSLRTKTWTLLAHSGCNIERSMPSSAVTSSAKLTGICFFFFQFLQLYQQQLGFNMMMVFSGNFRKELFIGDGYTGRSSQPQRPQSRALRT